MHPEDAVVAVVTNSPDNRLEGRKRLQKLTHLLSLAGMDIDADFEIFHYGPYSSEIARAANLMSLVGKIDEEVEPVGPFGTYQSVYSSSNQDAEIKLNDNWMKILGILSRYSTVELEIASTVGFFVNEGFSYKDSVNKTRQMKPTRAIAPVVAKAKTILGELSLVT